MADFSKLISRPVVGRGRRGKFGFSVNTPQQALEWG